MRLLRVIFSCLSIIMISACSTSYKELSDNAYTPPTKFAKHLMDSYKTKADFEAKEMHDWNSAKLYSEKALAAATGKKIKPEKVFYWKIPIDKVTELQMAYENLMVVYENAIEKDPYNLAVAISSLDCWAEQQEENWQTWDIEKCKNDYLIAMHNIYNTINKKEINEINTTVKNTSNETTISNETTSVVTKNKNNEILQIIYFDFDKSSLTQISLDEIKKFLKQYRQYIKKYLIVGHADTKGTKEYNLELSIKRALAIKNILIKNGINERNIKIIGKGEESLLIKTEDEIAHPANRRAEISPIN